jgi:WhiB family redox-sensing transcriptional regulator
MIAADLLWVVKELAMKRTEFNVDLPIATPSDDEPNFMKYGLCAQTDPEAFFPEKGGSTRDAKKVCGACAYRAACLEYALVNGERFGIWGGLSERERRRLKGKSQAKPQDV